MDATETPIGDTETGEPTKTMASKSPPEAPAAKGMKASVGERVLIGVLLTVVIALAIGGIVFATVVLHTREGNANVRADDWHGNEDMWGEDGTWRGPDDIWGEDGTDDWRWKDDDLYANLGETIIDSPFEIEDSFFSLNATESYASIEDLRKDIEVLAKTFANTIILEEANRFQRNGLGERFTGTSTPTSGSSEEETEETTSFFETSREVDITASVATARTRSFEKVNDFDTYQQEAGVASEDLVKSDGEYVFLGSGNSIEVWDIEGNFFETTTIQSVWPANNGRRTEEFEDFHNSNCDNSNHIEALHMNKEKRKLTVISNDYCISNFLGMTVADPIIDDSSTTRITIFSIDGSSLTEISHTHVDGYHANSYAVGPNVHVVTKTRLRTTAFINGHLYRYNFHNMNRVQDSQVLTNEEYVAVAKRRAEEIMPEFVDKVVDFVTEGDEIILSRVVGFRNSVDDYSSVTQVSSFDLSNVSGVDDIELHASKSMTFQAGSQEYYFATDEWIWVSHLKYVRGPLKMEYFEETMLLGFRLDGASSTFAAVGSVPGHLLNEFSIDFVKDEDKEYVRVAVTEFFNNFEDDWTWSQTTETTSDDETESRTLNQIIILEVPKVEDDSQTIHTLEQLGSVSVGKKHEFITAVRFFDNISYVVTFEQTDPFYVLDLSNPEQPKVLGEFEVTGFSEFMHPIKEDNSMLLTVGQNADETGMITGFQVSIFNSTNPTDPKLVDRLVIGDENGHTSSASTWDAKSFRYIQVDEVGLVIIPLRSYNWETNLNFDGFAVFDIDLNASESIIKREILINHEYESDSQGCYCYSNTYLPGRSFVFDGKLMTLKNQVVVSTELVSPEYETQWTHSFIDPSEDCCNHW